MSQPVTRERLERALLALARLMERHGEVLRPIMDRLEREYLAMKAAPVSEVERVRALIGAEGLER